MNEFKIRTEDLKTEEVLSYYVKTSLDEQIIGALMSSNPIILEGSRGTGKSFLLKIAEARLHDNFERDKILPVYVCFVKSSLIYTKDLQQFQHWMLARLCSRIIRQLYAYGLLAQKTQNLAAISGGQEPDNVGHSKIEEIADAYEDSYKHPNEVINHDEIPDIEQFKDTIQDMCVQLKINKILIFFDDAAHIFRPEQQRQFFTLFRDLRSPYISCNAAVYPGVTYYGEIFQKSHDATVVKINRDIMDSNYLSNMREIVTKQADSALITRIEKNSDNFNALAYAVSGNPRILLKTVDKASKMDTNSVKEVLKEYYRTDIWSEHTNLGEKYAAYKRFIDWGRKFIEETVIPKTKEKNDNRINAGTEESTCTFWIHRDAPVNILEAIRFLSYTGIVQEGESGIVATRRAYGTRYSINLGCLVAPEADPIKTILEISRHLTPKRFTEFSANDEHFKDLVDSISSYSDSEVLLEPQLRKSLDSLDIPAYQREGLLKMKLDTVGKVLNASEEQYDEIYYVGKVRARQIRNAVLASVFEYLSG